MKTLLHKSETRGHFDYGWLDTHHTFSFARYYDPQRENFGALRVLNDDIIKPAEGFGRHPHYNMEIITVPITGSVLHRDSMGHEEVIKAGEIQVMSAGTGIFHEEYNASNSEDTSLLQIWIFPKEKNIKPVYNQTLFEKSPAENAWQKLVTHNDPETLHIHQDAIVSRTFLDAGKELDYSLMDSSFGSYLFVIDGEIEIAGQTLNKRDGLGVSDTKSFSVKAKQDSYILNLEIPA
jgi:redox-sensitive bicupin YhaK (pirin superfamily)